MYYRMEVLSPRGWVGYFNGLSCWCGLPLTWQEHDQIRCSLSVPPSAVRFDRANADFTCWATETGWEKMADDVLRAMIIAEEYGVSYRVLTCVEPPSPNLAWCDSDQYLFLPPFRNLEAPEIEETKLKRW